MNNKYCEPNIPNKQSDKVYRRTCKKSTKQIIFDTDKNPCKLNTNKRCIIDSVNFNKYLDYLNQLKHTEYNSDNISSESQHDIVSNSSNISSESQHDIVSNVCDSSFSDYSSYINSDIENSKYDTISPDIMDYLTEGQIASFNKNGFIVIKGIRDNKFCNNYVDEIWRCITDAPWDKDKGINKIPNGNFAPLKGIKAKKEDKEWLKNLKIGGKASETKWFPGQFSAPAIPPLFNLQHSWINRQDPIFYNIYRQLLSSMQNKNIYKLWCSIDRVSIKPPGMGDDNEFYHWDSDPWHWDNDKYVGLQGMLSLSDNTKFTLFTGTHTMEFRDLLIDRNNGIDPNNEKKKLWISKGDKGNVEPMIKLSKSAYPTLDKCKKVINLGKGDLIIWSNRLMHLASKNTSDYMRYAQYIQFDPAGRCRVNDNTLINQNPDLLPQGDIDALLTTYRYKSIINDRIYSYLTGKMPYTYPGGGLTTNALRPHIWRSQMKHLNTRYAERFKEYTINNSDINSDININDIKTRHIVEYRDSKLLVNGRYKDKLKNNEMTIPIEINEWDPRYVIGRDGKPMYTPIKLSNLGEKLLGIKCWE